MMTTQQAEQAPAATGEGITLYGQTLHPERFPIQDSDYTWDDLKEWAPKLLPDSQTSKLSAEETCDHIVKMTDLYLTQVDTASNYLAFKLGPFFPGKDTDLELSERLISRSPKALAELMKLLPEEQPKIVMAKELTLKSLAMIMLHDAALANCEPHARAKGYFMIGSTSEPEAEPPAAATPESSPEEPAKTE